MGDREQILSHIRNSTFPCSDGKCRNINGGRMYPTYNKPPGISMEELINYLKNKGISVSQDIKCQTGKAICVKVPK